MDGARMKSILITGFEPFDNETLNSSRMAIEALSDEIGGYRLTRLILPVTFSGAARAVIEKAEQVCPDVILSIGQAGGRTAVTPEMVGINLRYAVIPDNEGRQPRDEQIIVGGIPAHFSTLPVRKIAEAISASGIPSAVSYSAGAYVCNDLLYTLLSHFEGTSVRVGFIHVPYVREQGKEPSMPLDDVIAALKLAIENLDE